MSDGGHGGGGGGGHKRRGHDEEHEEHENHERWLVSYADMMTLLMVLFIVLFAISQVDAKKFMALKTGLQAGFGAPVAALSGGDALLDVGSSVVPEIINVAGTTGGKESGISKTDKANPDTNAQTKAQNPATPQQVAELSKATNQEAVKQEVNNLVKAQQEIQKALAKQGLKDAATYRFDERGLHVAIATDKVLFDSGSATLRPEGRTVLDAVIPPIAKLPNKLSVDGHTNKAPISTAQFPSNWELSTARATGVLRYMTSKISVNRMSASGFADTRPLKPYTDPTAMTANRRVEIVVLAQVDNSLGQAVETLGQQALAGESTGSSGGTEKPSGSGSSPAPSASADAATGDPWASPSAPEASPSDWAADGATTTEKSSGGTPASSEDPWGAAATPAEAKPSDWTK